MRKMKKNKFYRICAGLLTALLVFTSIPQTFSSAEEDDIRLAEELEAGLYVETPEEETGEELEEEDTYVPEAILDEEEYSLEREVFKAETYVPTEAALEVVAEENVENQSVNDNEGELLPLDDTIPVTGIKLNKNAMELQKNATEKLSWTYEPTNADEGTDVTFSSNKETVATVDGVGQVTAVGVGVATITVRTGNGKEDYCTVTVTPIHVESLTFDQANLEMTKSESKELTISVLPLDADSREIKVWSGGGTASDCVEVSKTYDDTTKQYKVSVKAIRPGNTTIYAESQDNPRLVAKCPVVVNYATIAITGLKKTHDNFDLYVGQSRNLSSLIEFQPADTTQRGLTWSVKAVTGTDSANDGNYVTVNEQGLVTADNLPDDVSEKEVTVVATSTEKPDVSTGFTLKIKKQHVPVKELLVDPTILALEDGGRNQTKTVTVKLDPTNTTDREITATSSDEDVAKVKALNAEEAPAESAKVTADATGKAVFTVVAGKQGDCKITFTAGTGKNQAECSVTVGQYVAPVDSITLSESSLSIVEDGDSELTAEIKPLAAEDKDIIWSVSDPEVAMIVEGVDEDGRQTAQQKDAHLLGTIKIKALMVGECTVTATAAGGVRDTCKVIVTPGATQVAGLDIRYNDGKDDGVNPDELTIKRGKTYELTPVVTPEGANQKVRWSSSSLDVASVEVGANYVGSVKANQLGECTITAQASSSLPTCTKTVTVHVAEPHMVVNYPENWSYTPDMQPISEDVLKSSLEVLFYPIENLIPQKDMQTLVDYQLKMLGEDGRTEQPYDETCMEKPGVKILVVSYGYEGKEYKQEIPVTMEEFASAKLVEVTPLSADEAEVWNVPSGTPASSMPLAKTIEIVVKGEKSGKISKVDAQINWNMAETGYNPDNMAKQDFTVYGEVVLPDYVKNDDGVSLRIEARVHVRELAVSGKRAARPTFSVLDGEQIKNATAVTVPYGSKIVIASPTEEAEIYYMLDRRPDAERGIPHDDEHRYRSPLEITAKTTTIYAIAAKDEYDDSECSECTIKLIPEEPTVPDDPDDPDDPIPDDVTDKDKEEVGDKIPDGLWVAIQTEDESEKSGFAYTGKAIKPEIHVYDHTRLLTERKDYTLSYKNNINAKEKGAANCPSITVTGRGNYEGKMVVNFTIKPKNISDDDVMMNEYVAVAHTGKAQKPVISLAWNGKKLSNNKDFTTDAAVSYTDPGSYSIRVTGTGNYTGERTMIYEISNIGVLVSKLTISKIPDQKCTGKSITPPITVKYKNVALTEGRNYTVKYVNNIKVGTASAIITGMGNYKGSKSIDFKIKASAKISEAGIAMTFEPATPVYMGEPVKPRSYTLVYDRQELKEGEDYKVSYKNNNKAGTASVIFTGIGRFTGTAQRTFKINAGDITQASVESLQADYPYQVGGAKPKPKVVLGNRTLVEGTDYTLSYRNNNKVGNTASVTIKGKGNYKGNLVRNYAVTVQDIANLKVVATDKAYQSKANIYKTKVQVIDLNGKPLRAGTDYSKDISYIYANGPSQGNPVIKTDIIPVGTLIQVEVRVANPGNYQGIAYGTYRIVQADISKAKVNVDTQIYTGRKVKPKKNQIHVSLANTFLGENDFEIVSYENNVKQGTAKVTIRGIGSYGGTKTVNFKIRKKGIVTSAR